MDRIFCVIRVGDVALDAVNSKDTVQRAATAVADLIAKRFPTTRFADQTPVNMGAARLECFQYHFRPVGRDTFFIRGK